MQGLDTKIIEPYKIIGKLNHILNEYEGYLSLGRNTVPKVAGSFFDRIRGREVDIREQRPIIQTSEDPGLNPFNVMSHMFGDYDHQRTVGYLWFQEGNKNLDDHYEPRFANLEFRLWKPLKTEKCLLPYLNIKIYLETEEWGETDPDRVDHIKIARLLWKRTDLSEDIPTEWFLR